MDDKKPGTNPLAEFMGSPVGFVDVIEGLSEVGVTDTVFCPSCNRVLIRSKAALNVYNCRVCNKGWTEDQLKERVLDG